MSAVPMLVQLSPSFERHSSKPSRLPSRTAVPVISQVPSAARAIDASSSGLALKMDRTGLAPGAGITVAFLSIDG